jgi:hypothetical protein
MPKSIHIPAHSLDLAGERPSERQRRGNIPAQPIGLANECQKSRTRAEQAAEKLKTEGAGGFNPLNNANGIVRALAPDERSPSNSVKFPSLSAACESPAYLNPNVPALLHTLVLRFPVAISLLTLLCCFALPVIAQQGPQKSQPRVLDHVIAVVNNQVILASDLELEQRFARLLPIGNQIELDPKEALERLTTRALIEQQILQEDPHGLEIPPAELQDSLDELRKNLPGCRHRNCSSEADWKAYLATLDLTPDRVSEYWSRRMAVLRFIERRFRSGIRITPEEIEKYYKESLVPRYAKPEDAPKLEQISPRIQEILLQQQVNALLSDWLKSLQDQGQVEILDPSLRPSPASGTHSLSVRPSNSGEPPGKEAGNERS